MLQPEHPLLSLDEAQRRALAPPLVRLVRVRLTFRASLRIRARLRLRLRARARAKV